MKKQLYLLGLFIVLLSLGFLTSAAISPASQIRVPVATDFAAIAKNANTKGLPVLLVFSAEHCAYCELLENEIIKPMILSGDYQNRVLIYKVMIDDSNQLRDFNGMSVSAEELAQHYGVYVTPTMLFLDSRGKELSERILGINTVEMFGGLVDQAINISHQQLHESRKRLAKNLAP